MYCELLDILLVYGKENVYQWADLDNSRITADINEIIEFAIVDASEKIDAHFLGSGYEVPLADADGETPEVVKRWCARLAGAILYKARGYESEEDSVIKVEKQVYKDIADVLAGITRIKAVQKNYKKPMVGILYDARTCE